MQRKLIEYADIIYPEKLRELKNPPSRLYTCGNFKLLNKKGISIVGSRSNTQYGEKMCIEFTKNLTEYNLIIISGLAIGIDSIAHKTCLKYSGKTIAVLPCGLNNIYPKQNIELAKKIIKDGGLLITEYDDNIEADSKKFLERNRIVAGLGMGTLVVEGGYRSGTSVTAKITQELNKPVFCIPSSIENKKGFITNKLIKNGANLVTNVEDILNYFDNIKFKRKRKNLIKKEETVIIPQELKQIYICLKNEELDINQISRKCKISIQETSYKLLLLQMEDLVEELPGQRFKIKEK